MLSNLVGSSKRASGSVPPAAFLPQRLLSLSTVMLFFIPVGTVHNLKNSGVKDLIRGNGLTSIA